MKNIDIQSILEQEVTRKQFLKQLGIALIAIIGVPSFLKSLTDSFQPSSTVINNQSVQVNQNSGAYGYSAYSGVRGSN